MKKLLAILALANAANAATITYTNFVSGFTDFVADVGIPQFNPALGVLRGVVVQAQCIERKTIAFENRGNGGQTFSTFVTNTVNITIPGATDSTYTSSFSSSKLLSTFDGVRDYAGASGWTTNSTTTNAVQLAVTNTVPFAGYSVIPIHVVAVGKFAGNYPGGAYAQSVDDIVEVRVLVSYTFDPCLFVMVNENRKLRRVS